MLDSTVYSFYPIQNILYTSVCQSVLPKDNWFACIHHLHFLRWCVFSSAIRSTIYRYSAFLPFCRWREDDAVPPFHGLMLRFFIFFGFFLFQSSSWGAYIEKGHAGAASSSPLQRAQDLNAGIGNRIRRAPGMPWPCRKSGILCFVQYDHLLIC